MDYDELNSRLSLKIVVIISAILVSMDLLEIYYSFNQLITAKIRFNETSFQDCIKYNILSQIVFTFFAALAGISAFLLGTGLLYDSDYFAERLSRSYLYLNYVIFGPYLLTASFFGMIYFDNIVFTCDQIFVNRYFNISNLMSLIVCFILSVIISLGYSFFDSVKFIYLSVTFKHGGFKPLGKFFWNYVTNRNIEVNNTNASNVNDNQQVLNNIQNHEISTLIINDLSGISASFIMNENAISNEELRNFDEIYESEHSINSETDKESQYKNDKLCEMLLKIINNEIIMNEARKRAIKALNLRKKLLIK